MGLRTRGPRGPAGAGGASLPEASAAGQLLRSTGAGDEYEAVDQADVLGDQLTDVGEGEVREALGAPLPAGLRGADGAYHWWPLDDASGGAADAGSAGTALSEAGSGAGTLRYRARVPVGPGMRFSGNSGSGIYLLGAQDAGVALTTTATLSAWVRAEAVSGNRDIVYLETNQGTNGQPYYSLALGLAGSGEVRALVTTTAQPGSVQLITGAGVLAGVLHLLAVTFDSGTLTIWIDGTIAATGAVTGDTIFTGGANERWSVGDATGPGERFNGTIADVRVYQTTKDAAWFAETYQRGVGSYAGQ